MKILVAVLLVVLVAIPGGKDNLFMFSTTTSECQSYIGLALYLEPACSITQTPRAIFHSRLNVKIVRNSLMLCKEEVQTDHI